MTSSTSSPSKVWVVELHIAYEGSDIVHVCVERQSVINYIMGQKRPTPWRCVDDKEDYLCFERNFSPQSDLTHEEYFVASPYEVHP